MRPKEFNRNSVLEKCITLFWTEGYNATGIQEIVTQTGVNRYSLYEEFGNKEGILLASMELYNKRHVPFELLAKPSPIRENLFQFYNGFFKPHEANGRPIGCYIATLSMELRDLEEMQPFFNTYLDLLKQNFAQLLEKKSNLSKDRLTTVSEQPTFFYCTSMSMFVIFPQKETEKRLHDNLNLITKCLDK
ncbi:MAG: TetR/AcrR family transcriptional regulator [Flavobacteriales bacterium]|nr:TetR/AcrR family transcriptional regulator [Flavobacteriales bacterium]